MFHQILFQDLVGVRSHRAELVGIEDLAAVAKSCLPKKDGALRGQFHNDRDGQHDRQGDGQRNYQQCAIHQSLNDSRAGKHQAIAVLKQH